MPKLKAINIGSKPKELIQDLSEIILTLFSKVALVEKYDIYQHLMTYWAETMQDDVYLIAVNGWRADIKPIRNKKGKEIGWNCDLIPKNIVIDKYFTREKESIDKLQSELEAIQQQMLSLEEDNSGEEDLFAEVRNYSGKISKGDISKRIKELNTNQEFKDELEALQNYLILLDKDLEISKKIELEKELLDKNLLTKYKALNEAEIKELVIENKWIATLHRLVKEELERVSEKLAGRLIELAERYATPLPELTAETEKLSYKVNDHLKEMGFKW